MFSLYPSILAFNLIHFKGNFFLAFWGKEIGYFEGWGQIQIVLAIFGFNEGLKDCFGVYSWS